MTAAPTHKRSQDDAESTTTERIEPSIRREIEERGFVGGIAILAGIWVARPRES